MPVCLPRLEDLFLTSLPVPLPSCAFAVDFCDVGAGGADPMDLWENTDLEG